MAELQQNREQKACPPRRSVHVFGDQQLFAAAREHCSRRQEPQVEEHWSSANARQLARTTPARVRRRSRLNQRPQTRKPGGDETPFRCFVYKHVA